MGLGSKVYVDSNIIIYIRVGATLADLVVLGDYSRIIPIRVSSDAIVSKTLTLRTRST